MYSSYDYYYDYSRYHRAAELGETFAIVAAVLAVVFMFLIIIFITPERKRDKLPGFFKVLHDIFNFNGLIIELLLQVAYIIITVFTILYSFLMIFTGYNILTWIITMVFGPIAIRVFFELVMMGVLLVKNVISINNKLKYPENKKETSADHNISGNINLNRANNTNPVFVQKPVMNNAANANPVANDISAKEPVSEPADAGLVCPGCGNKLSGSEAFCGKCGTKINR